MNSSPRLKAQVAAIVLAVGGVMLSVAAVSAATAGTQPSHRMSSNRVASPGSVEHRASWQKRETDEYPKAGKIVLGLPHWNRKLHRFQPIAPRECDREVADFQPGQPISWVARLRHTTIPTVTARILSLSTRRPRLLYSDVQGLPGKNPLIHSILSKRSLQRYGITMASGGHHYELIYVADGRALATGRFDIWPATPITIGY